MISDPLCKTENFKFSISVTAGSPPDTYPLLSFLTFECDVDETSKKTTVLKQQVDIFPKMK